MSHVVYQHDPQGYFTESIVCQDDPQTGEPLIPANCVAVAPPAIPEQKAAKWNDQSQAWEIVDDPIWDAARKVAQEQAAAEAAAQAEAQAEAQRQAAAEAAAAAAAAEQTQKQAAIDAARAENEKFGVIYRNKAGRDTKILEWGPAGHIKSIPLDPDTALAILDEDVSSTFSYNNYGVIQQRIVNGQVAPRDPQAVATDYMNHAGIVRHAESQIHDLLKSATGNDVDVHTHASLFTMAKDIVENPTFYDAQTVSRAQATVNTYRPLFVQVASIQSQALAQREALDSGP